jgi:hypothetical protein
MREVFAPVQAEDNPQTRAELLDKIEHEFADLLLEQYERTCWEIINRSVVVQKEPAMMKTNRCLVRILRLEN